MAEGEVVSDADEPRSGGFRARRYLLVVPLAALLFIALAMIEQRDTFLPAIGLARAPTADLVAGADAARTARLGAAVTALNRAYAAASAAGTPGPLAGAPIAAALRRELVAALGVARARGELPARLASSRLIGVAPADGGRWSLTTEETWRGGTAARPWRSTLRFSYRLTEEGGGARIEEIRPATVEVAP